MNREEALQAIARRYGGEVEQLPEKKFENIIQGLIALSGANPSLPVSVWSAEVGFTGRTGVENICPSQKGTTTTDLLDAILEYRALLYDDQLPPGTQVIKPLRIIDAKGRKVYP